MNYYKSASIKKICIWGFVLRLFVLAIIVLFGNELTTGFLSSDIINDDVRYQAGAEIYALKAKNVFDINALGNAYYQAGDYSIIYGSGVQLWYWIVAIAMYIFRTHVVVKILNIAFAILTIKYIYDIGDKIYGRKAALIAASLYAFLPYPVFFSCFLYKDQFYTLVVLAIFRIIILKGTGLNYKDLLYLVPLFVLATTIRTGLSVFILVVVIYLYVRLNGSARKSKFRIWLIAPILLVGLYFLFEFNAGSIDRKFDAYVLGYEASSDGIVSLISIKSIYEIYKYPIALLFMMLLPIQTKLSITSWADITGILNIIVVPVAIGVLWYFANWKIRKSPLFWGIQVLYLITIVSSLGIFRHSYYLQPYMMLFFAHFIVTLSSSDKKNFKFVSVLMTLSYSFLLLLR